MTNTLPEPAPTQNSTFDTADDLTIRPTPTPSTALVVASYGEFLADLTGSVSR